MTEKLRKCESRYKKDRGQRRLEEKERGKKHRRTEISKLVIWLGTNIGEA